MLKITHCITDDKFAKTTLAIFDYMGDRCQNDYVYVLKDDKKALQFIGELASIKRISPNHFLEHIQSEQTDVVILHNLRSLPLHLIHQIPSKVKVVWFAWGFDMYSRIGSKPLVEVPNIYHTETKRLLRPTLKEWVYELARTIYKSLKDKDLKKAVERVDFFSGVLPYEYQLMQSVPYFKAQPLEFRYKNPQKVYDVSQLDEVKPKTGMNIMIGNSGDPANNHADIFKRLSTLELGDRKIIVPLSYAGNSRYKKQVKAMGERLWGNRFMPLEEFMPYYDYLKLLFSCRYRIFGHERQQSIGNIRQSFRSRSKVFLSETSIVYKQFTSQGFHISTIQHDLTQEGLTNYSDEETYINRKLALEETNSSRQFEMLNQMIDTLEQSL